MKLPVKRPVHRPSPLFAGLARWRFGVLGGLLLFHLLAGWGRWGEWFEDSAIECITLPLRVAAGDVPYRDVCPTYGPLSYLVDAALYRAFGHPALTLLVVNVAGTLLLLVGLDRASQSLFSPVQRLAFLVGFTGLVLFPDWKWRFVMCLLPYNHAGFYSAIAQVWMLVFLQRALRSSCLAAWIGAGLCLGGIALLKLEFLPPALLCVVAALVLFWMRCRLVPAFLAAGGALLFGLLCALGPVVVWFSSRVELSMLVRYAEILHAISRFNPRSAYPWMPALRSLGVPLMAWAIAALTFRFRSVAGRVFCVAASLGLAGLALYLGRRGTLLDQHLFVATLLPPGALFALGALLRSRWDPRRWSGRTTGLVLCGIYASSNLARVFIGGLDSFMFQGLAVVDLFLAWFFFRGAAVCARGWGANWNMRPQAAWVLPLLAVLGSLLAANLHVYRSKVLVLRNDWGVFHLVDRPSNRAALDAARWIREHSRPGERVFFGPLGGLWSLYSARLNGAHFERPLYLSFHPEVASGRKASTERDEELIGLFRNGRMRIAAINEGGTFATGVRSWAPGLLFGRDYAIRFSDFLQVDMGLRAAFPVTGPDPDGFQIRIYARE